MPLYQRYLRNYDDHDDPLIFDIAGASRSQATTRLQATATVAQ